MSAEPRPALLDLSDQLPGDDSAPLWRVYRPEWVTVWTVAAGPQEPRELATRLDLQAQATEHFEMVYGGRIREEDWRLFPGGTIQRPMVRLQLRLPTMKGEFKRQRDAASFILLRQWPDAAVVAKDSAEDHDQRNYGVRKLKEQP